MKRLPSHQEVQERVPPEGVMFYASNTKAFDNSPILPKWMRYDPFLWAIVALFIIYELVAHFYFHNSTGMRTLSNRVYAFIREFGWPARAVVALVIAALSLHFQGVY